MFDYWNDFEEEDLISHDVDKESLKLHDKIVLVNTYSDYVERIHCEFVQLSGNQIAVVVPKSDGNSELKILYLMNYKIYLDYDNN